VPAWDRICARVKLTISWAMSVSRIRLSEAERFSTATLMFLMVCSNRFCIAPRFARAVETYSICRSMWLIDFWALACVSKLRPVVTPSSANASSSPFTARLLDTVATLAEARLTEIAELVSPSAPTWKFSVPAPLSSLVPLKFVDWAIRLSSSTRLSASVVMFSRALVLFESFAAWTPRSRRRCRIECTSVSAPSAVWTTLMPSWALRAATFRPPTWERRPSEIARPAASSAARLIRKPDDSFSSDLLRSFWVLLRLR